MNVDSILEGFKKTLQHNNRSKAAREIGSTEYKLRAFENYIGINLVEITKMKTEFPKLKSENIELKNEINKLNNKILDLINVEKHNASLRAHIQKNIEPKY